MSKAGKKPFGAAPFVFIPMGAGFIAVGLAGQPTFGYMGLGFLIAGVVPLMAGLRTKRRRV
ncbi:hypothetical protein [Pseudomonas rubra]|uniref:Uncharacterized protein n=1 Tax=Pseudomonas rubra TaxID=2942627 RepID=A0ABT5PFG7_9PSED|nr:hypothetical protein [Pseudomonas rubra]MDD1017056.1 hypothetical protein [Pseudomonas rubra]MDD1037115.1 hypothetical protein [Pseudomonas rubra]MDD1153776.1 hypothetical protein [Pseudomonas rubra]